MRQVVTSVVAILFGLALLAFGLFEVVYGHEYSLVERIPFLVETQYWKPSALAIVLGGVLTSSFTMYPPRYVFKGIGNVFYYFNQSTIDLETLKGDIDRIVNWSNRIEENKLQALKEIQEENDNHLTGYLFSLVSTNYDTEDIETFGQTNIEEHYDREMVNEEVLRTMGNSSPAFGMFGTLCGLLMVMEKFDTPQEMGAGLATALTTTLYGIVLAHLVFYPCARKLRNIAQIKRFREYLLLDGVLMINDGKSNFYIRDKLTSYLARSYSFNNNFEGESTYTETADQTS